LSAKVLEAAADVGGTWYWNRYPGARCDIPTTDYTFSFDPELEKEWTWSEKYATQPEILEYLRFVADRHELRSDIEFSTAVTAARWDEPAKQWVITTGGGREVRCRHYIMATGCLSVAKSPDIEGAERFAGPVYFTAAGRTRALTSPASGSRSSAPARRASSPSRSSPARPASSRSSSAPRTSPSPRTTARPRPRRCGNWTMAVTRTAMPPGGPGEESPSSRPMSSPGPPARRSAASGSRRPGSRASCSASSTSSPTRA